MKVACCSRSLSKVETNPAPIGQKEPLWHTKTKAKAGNTLGERNTMRQNREESKSKTKVAARDKPHGEGKKRNQKLETERRNKSYRRKKEKKKKKGI